VTVLQEAAGLAIPSGSPSVAVRLLERALREPPAPEREPQLLVEYVRAQTLAGSPPACRLLEESLERIAPAECRADALAELAMSYLVRSEFARAAELAARARAELPQAHPDRQRLLAIELAAATRCPELRGTAEQLLDPVIGRLGGGELPSDARLLAVAVEHLGMWGPADAVPDLARAAVAEDPLLGDPYGFALERLAAGLECSDELEPAERWLDPAIDEAENRGLTLARATAFGCRARVRHHRGRLRGAANDGRRALELFRELSATPAWLVAGVAATQIAIGDLGSARTLIARGLHGRDPSERRWLLEARARLQLSEGDPAAALRSAEAAGDIAEAGTWGTQPRVCEWRRLAATAAHRLRYDERAMTLVAPDLQALGTSGPARQLGAALTIAGLATGGHDGLELLAEAATVLEGSAATLQVAETRLELGAAMRRAGRRTAAKEPLAAALELAGRAGAMPLADRARDELRRLGLRPRRSARSGVESLTPSERRVAELAAAGLSTPMISARLYVSRNTVETHLRHIYRKLNLAGRGELRGLLAEPAVG
jgi:DNA-binding NarL/FixJ family response regulator